MAGLTTYVAPVAMAASKSADVRLLEAADASAVWKVDEHAAMARAAERIPRTNIIGYMCGREDVKEERTRKEGR